MTYDCIVVGAGAAGLAADRTLRAAGAKSLLLEAKERTGGRCWTSELAPGVTWDHGAQWLHQATENPMRAEADRLGFDYLRRERPQFVFWNRDHWADEAEEAELAAYYNDAFAAISRLGREKGDVAMSEALDASHPWRPLFDYWHHAVAGAPPDEASAADELRYGPGEGDWPVVEGYGRLLAKIFEDHRARLNCPVSAIDWSGKTIKVTTPGGEIETKSVILTVSIDVLRQARIRFSPELPTAKQDACHGLFLSQVNKVAILLEGQPFSGAEERGSHYFLEDGRAFGMQLHPFGKPLALAFLAGPPASDLEREGPQAMADFVIEETVKAWGGDFRNAIKRVETTGWCHDPCFGGGYSLARPGQTRARDALAEPIADKLFFAGEATIPAQSGTVHGAYLSGLRAAEEALTAVSAKAARPA